MIHAIFIIKKGICLFSRQYSKKIIESHIFSGFLSALMQFAKEVSQKELSKIVIENDIFSLYLVDNISFVFKHDDMKVSKLEKISQQISHKFLECFSKELKNWTGDVECFHDFDKEADRIVKLEGGEILVEMEEFLREKKAKRLQEIDEKTEEAKRTLIEMEKFLRKRKQD